MVGGEGVGGTTKIKKQKTSRNFKESFYLLCFPSLIVTCFQCSCWQIPIKEINLNAKSCMRGEKHWNQLPSRSKHHQTLLFCNLRETTCKTKCQVFVLQSQGVSIRNVIFPLYKLSNKLPLWIGDCLLFWWNL